MADLVADARKALKLACEAVGLDPSEARLLRLRSNAVFHLPSASIIVRITPSASAPHRMPHVLKMTQWLEEQGFPTVVPVADLPQPILLEAPERTVTLWKFVPVDPVPPRTYDLARLLRRLHSLPLPPVELPLSNDPLKSIRYDVGLRPQVLTEAEHAWLSSRIGELTEAWHQLPQTHSQVIQHGDAWIDNLLWHEDGYAVLCDWDSVGLSRRPEWDLIHTYHGQRRFGLKPSAVNEFAAAYGFDLREWNHYETIMAIRDLYAVGIHIRNAPGDPFSRQELTLRLNSLMSGDQLCNWNLRSPEHP